MKSIFFLELKRGTVCFGVFHVMFTFVMQLLPVLNINSVFVQFVTRHTVLFYDQQTQRSSCGFIQTPMHIFR